MTRVRHGLGHAVNPIVTSGMPPRQAGRRRDEAEVEEMRDF